MSSALDHLVEELGVDVGTTLVVLADDFAGEVEAADREISLRRGEDARPPFTVERLGGKVVGKTLAHDDGYRDATVIVASESISWDDQGGFAAGLGLIAHELAHVCIGRARWSSGALDCVPFPSHTGTEFARSIARISTEEYRATMLANIVIGALMSVDSPGAHPRRLTVHDISGDCYTDRFAEVLDEIVHPGWPDVVTDYRWGRVSFEALRKHIIESTDQVFTILGHAEAHAEAGGRPLPLEACRGHRGTDLYIGSAWERLIKPARMAAPLPPSLVEIRTLEDTIVTEGEAAILAMWSTLGLTVEERGNREWALWVSDPQR